MTGDSLAAAILRHKGANVHAVVAEVSDPQAVEALADSPAVRTAPRLTRHIVVMGVSGSGKTTIAKGISASTGLAFAEADEYHSEYSVAMMRAGVPLDDVDRWPWLRALSTWMAASAAEGVSTVLACSALKRSYRDLLREGPPAIDFVHLDGPAETIRERMAQRAGHYMPPSLLDSQITDLEPLQPDESGLALDASLPPDKLVAATIARLGLHPAAQSG